MAADLYEADTLIWSERQATLLRRLAAGERVNDAVDWANVIEEIEDVGRSQLNAFESLLRAAMAHLLKLASGADRPAAHWRVETAGFLADALARSTPWMRQRMDLDALYTKARRQVRAAERHPKAFQAQPCPFTLDELLAEDVDVAALVDRLRAAP